MFQVYFDDSGTDAKSEIAIAACYISTKRGWEAFVEGWDQARWEEGFEVFHMADFVARPEHGHKPFCTWNNSKKDHVYGRLADIINKNKRIGIACAVPKKAYDERVPDDLKVHYGTEHYAFAVRKCLMCILEWREASLITLPMRYVFDWEMNTSEKRIQISKMLDTMHQTWRNKFGLEPKWLFFRTQRRVQAASSRRHPGLANEQPNAETPRWRGESRQDAPRVH
jgi:hypothetical protein